MTQNDSSVYLKINLFIFIESIEGSSPQVDPEAEIKSPENVAEVMGREARAVGNSHFLRPLRAPSQHFLRSLKKRDRPPGLIFSILYVKGMIE